MKHIQIRNLCSADVDTFFAPSSCGAVCES